MDKEKFGIILSLYEAETDGLKKKLIGILLADQKELLNKSKAIG